MYRDKIDRNYPNSDLLIIASIQKCTYEVHCE